MNPAYNPILTFGPLADDIIGISEIYGPSPSKSILFGNVGIGTDTPSAPLHVARSDGTARILVEDTSPIKAGRRLFELRNNGNTQFKIYNSAVDVGWVFLNDWFGYFRIGVSGTSGNQFFLDTSGNLTISGALTEYSDRNGKENFRTVDPQDVLEKVANIPISEWNYKADNDTLRHLGPMAQDFHAAFGLGQDNRHIATLDTSGVALAAIQGLYQQNVELKAELEALKRELAEIREFVAIRRNNTVADDDLRSARERNGRKVRLVR